MEMFSLETSLIMNFAPDVILTMILTPWVVMTTCSLIANIKYYFTLRHLIKECTIKGRFSELSIYEKKEEELLKRWSPSNVIKNSIPIRFSSSMHQKDASEITTSSTDDMMAELEKRMLAEMEKRKDDDTDIKSSNGGGEK
jgi:hypothetical protein